MGRLTCFRVSFMHLVGNCFPASLVALQADLESKRKALAALEIAAMLLKFAQHLKLEVTAAKATQWCKSKNSIPCANSAFCTPQIVLELALHASHSTLLQHIGAVIQRYHETSAATAQNVEVGKFLTFA